MAAENIEGVYGVTQGAFITRQPRLSSSSPAASCRGCHLLRRTRDCTLPLFVGGAAIFALAPTIPNPAAIITTLAVSTALIAAATPAYAAGSLELAPNTAGLLAGMQQAFANLAGIA